MTPAGSRLLPSRSAFTAPASITSAPRGSSEPAIHFLRAVTGLAGVRNQVQAAPPAIACNGCATWPEAMIMCVQEAEDVVHVDGDVVDAAQPGDVEVGAPPGGTPRPRAAVDLDVADAAEVAGLDDPAGL